MTEQTKPQSLQQLRTVAEKPREEKLPTIRAGFFDLQSFELMQRVAKGFASSTLVPTQYQDNVANCMIALNMAQRIGADPMSVMQNLYVVHGNPAWSAKFLVATVNACGRYSSLRYEWKGQPGADDYGCRAWAIETATGERLDGVWVTWAMVKAEGWDKKNGSKWKTMPDQMFIYRSASFWERAYAPELSMGLRTVEEVEDIVDVKQQPDGTYAADLAALRRGPAEPAPAENAPEAPAADPAPTGGGLFSDAQPSDQGRKPRAPINAE